MLLTFRVTLVSLLPRLCPEALMLMMLLITTGQLLCESRFPAKHSTEVILVNLLKVVLLSPPDQETSLERLRNFSKALQLETSEPEMELDPPKPVLSILTLECLWQEGRGEGMCFQGAQSPHRRSHFRFRVTWFAD